MALLAVQMTERYICPNESELHFGVKSFNLVRFVSLNYLLLMYWQSDSSG